MSKRRRNNVRTKMTTAGLVVGFVVMASMIAFTGGKEEEGSNNSKGVQKAGNVVIDKNEIGRSATFYPYELEGVELEVMAVKASDGTIRTAFNTCQICYASGRGYYKQQGEALICQNCGNVFTADDVQVLAGGCNPVPIFEEDKTETQESIEISEDFLKESKDIFLNWRANY